jgi:hypothetical protein
MGKGGEGDGGEEKCYGDDTMPGTPSVLPDISPSRGESGWRHSPRPISNVSAGASGRHESFSPLAGEMSGRTEGGTAG